MTIMEGILGSVEDYKESYENIKTVAQFIRSPGEFISNWIISGLEWTVTNSFEVCVIVAMFGLVLKMLAVDKGIKLLHGSLAAYIVIQILGAMFLD